MVLEYFVTTMIFEGTKRRIPLPQSQTGGG